MKNFKAKDILEDSDLIHENQPCKCCYENKDCVMIQSPYMGQEDNYVWVCLDCLQYTETQKRIKQLESWLYPEWEEFENNEKV